MESRSPMRKITPPIILITLITLLSIGLFQLADCYPEHGSDSLTFCTTSQFVHFLWRYDIGGIFLAYISALSSIILQVITFKILSKDKQSLLKAYLGSSIIPGIYGIFVITLIWNTLVTKWLIGTIILGLLSTIVTYYIGRIVGSWQK